MTIVKISAGITFLVMLIILTGETIEVMLDHFRWTRWPILMFPLIIFLSLCLAFLDLGWIVSESTKP